MFDSDIKPSLIKVTKALNHHNVEFMVIGGVAVASYGYHRPSGAFNSTQMEVKPDLDFWYNPTLSNFLNLQKALIDIGVAEDSLTPIIFDRSNYLKIDHGKFKTDFLPSLTGLESFETSMGSAKKINFGSQPLHIISYDDLVKNKKAVNRRTDSTDIDRMVNPNKDSGN